MPDLSFTVDVDFTDRRVDEIGFVISTKTVAVAAADPTDANLAAAQFVACLIGPSDMVVATRITQVAV